MIATSVQLHSYWPTEHHIELEFGIDPIVDYAQWASRISSTLTLEWRMRFE